VGKVPVSGVSGSDDLAQDGLDREPGGEALRNDDELYVGLAAHAVDGAGPAGSGGVLVASGFLGHSGDAAVRAADDGAAVIEWRVGAKVDDEPDVFAGALPLDLGSGFDTEEGVAFGVRDARGG